MKEILTNKNYLLADESATIAIGKKLADIVKKRLEQGSSVSPWPSFATSCVILTSATAAWRCRDYPLLSHWPLSMLHAFSGWFK